MGNRSAIVIGAGIVGLAVARSLAIKGFSVKVFDRTYKALGASIRNFGMIWPIGQPSGKLYERALRSRNIWREISDEAGFWYAQAGSLHVAYQNDEWEVLKEAYEIFNKDRKVELLSPAEISDRTNAVVQKNLLGGLYSADELIVDPREAIAALPNFLQQKYSVDFHWGKCITYISGNSVYIGTKEDHEADLIFVCSGSDFETLYPECFTGFAITRCKLQMMRFPGQMNGWKLGPALAAGLSLIHYKSFSDAPSLLHLRQRLEREMSEYVDQGIHVMLAQNGKGELTVGDSHEYGLAPDPFDKECINSMIINYLKQFVQLRNWRVMETWNGVYAKLTDGKTELIFSPEPGVHVVNGLGGAGMTLSFALAEELTNTL